MRDSVPSGSYSSVYNVLRQWNFSLIPTYRDYRLYDIEHVDVFSFKPLHKWNIINCYSKVIDHSFNGLKKISYSYSTVVRNLWQ